MVVEHECGAGHESAGEVVAVGEGVTKVKVGDRVAVEAGVPCGACGECRRGKYQVGFSFFDLKKFLDSFCGWGVGMS